MSIDEKEVTEVVGYRSKRNGLVDEDAHVLHEAEPLMTVAQHERIVDAERGAHLSQLRDWRVKFMNLEAAKDAEIARLNAGLKVEAEDKHEALAELRELRAQPARQVGVEDWAAVLERCLDEECGRSGNAVPVGVPIYSISLPEIIEAVRRAALAPAAVAVVMPEYIEPEGDYDPYRDGYNSAIDDCARLNRRAIPAGLLERICKDYTGRENWDALEPDRLAAAAELRALLGKS